MFASLLLINIILTRNNMSLLRSGCIPCSNWFVPPVSSSYLWNTLSEYDVIDGISSSILHLYMEYYHFYDVICGISISIFPAINVISFMQPHQGSLRHRDLQAPGPPGRCGGGDRWLSKRVEAFQT